VLTDDEVISKGLALKQLYAARDGRHADVSAVRRGDYNAVAPGMFPADLPKEIVANFVDTAARDLAEVIAPLPSFNCTSSNTVSDAARKRADKRSKIADSYVVHSDLETQMYEGADRYLTFSFLPIYVEPDFKAKTPRMTVESPVGGYPEIDRWGRVASYLKITHKTVSELCAMWPEYETEIRGHGPQQRAGNAMVELHRYCDADRIVMYLPQQGLIGNLVLTSYRHNLGEVPVKVAFRPQWDDEMRGQWDSVMYVQVARARMAQLAWEAAEKSVEAPIVATPDMQELAFGPDAILYSQSPEKVRRLPIEIPQSSFQELAQLGSEMRLGARYPEGRTGNLSASVVTGRGVQELLAGFDTQVKTAQARFKRMFREAIGLCFKMDELYWPNLEKTIRGTQSDAPYEVTYRAKKDIAGDHTVDVTYGMAAGLDPNRAVVLLLQLRGDRAISRDFMLRQMPFNINVTDELTRIDVEETRDALKQGFNGLAAAIPQLAAGGQDVTQIVAKLAEVVTLRQKGEQIEDAVGKVFAPEPPPAPAADASAPPGAGAPGAPGAGGVTEPLVPGMQPGQEAMGAGGSPDLQMLLAGLTSGGAANLQANISRRLPA
jgi:hypothetical protein